MKKTKATQPATNRVKAPGGRLTIPKSIVRTLTDRPEEATFVVQPMGDGVFVIPADKVSPALEAMLSFRQKADEAGVTLQDILEGLEGERARYTKEVYGK